MSSQQTKLAKLIEQFALNDGAFDSPVPETYCIKLSQPETLRKMHWRTSLAIVAQGNKEITLGNSFYTQNEGDYIFTPVDLPVASRVSSASIEKPFLSLLIIFDPLILGEVAARLENDFSSEKTFSRSSVFVGRANAEMLEAAIRLVKLFRTPEDARALSPLILKEMLYYLMKGSDGLAIRRFVFAGNAMHKISEIIQRINSELSRDIDIGTLATAAHMSRATFFKHFKEMTAMSPIQYQKRLRLLEARRLMTNQYETAEGAAFRVGYKSASQFNREYSRMFGDSPYRDAVRIKESGGEIIDSHTKRQGTQAELKGASMSD